MPNQTSLMLDRWNAKIKEIDFVHSFFCEEPFIYYKILTEKHNKLCGSIEDLSQAYNVSCESFFGFLLGLEPVLHCGLDTLKSTDIVDIDLDLGKLYAYLKGKESRAYLIKMDGWKDVADAAEADVKAEPVKRSKVGCLRFSKDPYTRMRSFSVLAHSYGEEIFYFIPEKVDMEKKTINGLFFDVDSQKFVEKETAYPYVIDDHGYFMTQYPDLYKELSRSSLFCYPRLQSKKKVYSVLKERGYSKYLIDTFDYTTSINIDDLLTKYGNLILKPNRSSMVKDVYKLNKENDYYFLQLEDKVEKLSRSEFVDKYTAKFLDGYLVQEYIRSVTNHGNPFNIKITVHRGKGGKWAVAKLFVRIGNVNGIASSIETGSGSIGFVNQLLPVEFGEDGKAIYDELIKTAKELPNTLQDGYSNLLDDLAIGVGIDRDDNNQLKIFDINIQADPLTHDVDALEARFHYLMYLSNNYKKLHRIQMAT